MHQWTIIKPNKEHWHFQYKTAKHHWRFKHKKCCCLPRGVDRLGGSTWQEEVGLTPVALVLITAHAVAITWDAGHVFVHAVRLSRAVPVAAVLKTNSRSCVYACGLPNTQLHSHSKTGLFSLCREARSRITATVRHTALLVEALNAGEAMLGVICWKQTKKTPSPFKQELPGKTLWTLLATHWGGKLGLL